MSNFMPMLYAFWDSDITYSFRKSRVAVISALVLLAMFLTAIFAPSLAPQDPFNIAELDLFDSELPPAWAEGGSAAYLLGTDTQARDVPEQDERKYVLLMQDRFSRKLYARALKTRTAEESLDAFNDMLAQEHNFLSTRNAPGAIRRQLFATAKTRSVYSHDGADRKKTRARMIISPISP